MRNRNKIKHVETNMTKNLTITYSLDEGMYQVNATVNMMAEKIDTDNFNVYNIDVNDVDLEFFINSKRCAYDGFKDMYEKLFGKDSYASYSNMLYDEFADHASKNCGLTHFSALCQDDLKSLFNDLASKVKTNTVGCLIYADDWHLVSVAKKVYPEMVCRVDVPYVNSESGRSYSHHVVDMNCGAGKYFMDK